MNTENNWNILNVEEVNMKKNNKQTSSKWWCWRRRRKHSSWTNSQPSLFQSFLVHSYCNSVVVRYSCHCDILRIGTLFLLCWQQLWQTFIQWAELGGVAEHWIDYCTISFHSGGSGWYRRRWTVWENTGKNTSKYNLWYIVWFLLFRWRLTELCVLAAPLAGPFCSFFQFLTCIWQVSTFWDINTF